MAAFESNWVMSAASQNDTNSPSSSTAPLSPSQSNEQPSSAASSSSAAAPTYASFTPSPATLPQHTSPLLSSTPPTVTKALSQAYPFILAADHVLSLLTWTSNDSWKSFLLVAIWSGIVLYYEILVKYFGHLLAVGGIAGYVWFNDQVEKEQVEHPTLDAIVHTLTNVVTRLNLFLEPVTSLSLTTHDVTRLLFTTLFLSPVYMILAFFVFTPRSLLLIGGLFVLTFHSVWARVTRAVLWRSRTVRLITFYLTGLDFSGSRRKNLTEAQKARTSSLGVQTKDGKPVRFTYVLYENQRRWLGIGWTANLLAYERAPWTDEFLNEAHPPETFKLPEAEGTGMTWRWVDKTWRLDMSNDGSLALSSNKPKTTADPTINDGYVYYDNTWKKPSAEDTFSKYTRRRRWVRTAELVNENTLYDESVSTPTPEDQQKEEVPSEKVADTDSSSSNKSARKRKSLRFDDSS